MHGTWLLRSTSVTREHRRELLKGRIDGRLLRTRSLLTQLIALGPREDGAPYGIRTRGLALREHTNASPTPAADAPSPPAPTPRSVLSRPGRSSPWRLG